MLDESSIKLVDSVYEVLEPHASYIGTGPEDENLYDIPVEVLQTLAWIATNGLLPIVTGVAVAGISTRIGQKERKQILKAMGTAEEEIKQISRDVSELVAESKRLPKPTHETAAQAKENVVMILKLNGWPTDLAKRDAEVIISKALKQLWP